MDRKVEIINNMPVGISDKYSLTLVCADAIGYKGKPAMDITSCCFDYDKDSLKNPKFEEKIEKIRNDLWQLELFHHNLPIEERVSEYDDEGRWFQPHLASEIYVAKDRESLCKLLQAETEEERLRCYGVPETAVEAYGDEGRRLPVSFIFPKGFQDYIGFAQFVMSEKHWLKEFETVLVWAETTKKLNPLVYDQLIKH